MLPPAVIEQRGPRGRLRQALQGIALRSAAALAKARARHELKALERSGPASQSLRAFIQINIQPRSR